MSSVLWNMDQVSLRGRQTPRLHPLTVQLHAGCTAVIGYSGAGKTSLLNLLVGFEKPDGGALTHPAGRVSWAPQNGGLWPHLTVREHFLTVRPGSPPPDDLLRDFDLTHKLASRPDELSEGEQSRLAVARALWTDAAVLVMDEPLVHVDPSRADRCWQAIRRHLAANDASLVFSTHSPETVLGEAGRALCLKAGRLLYDGSVDDLYRRPPSAELAGFLGPANWFAPEEARVWLDREEPAARCWRPEQIQVAPAARGTITVLAARFRGSVAEADLRHEPTGQRRRFYHRPASDRLRAGDPVTISFLT